MTKVITALYLRCVLLWLGLTTAIPLQAWRGYPSFKHHYLGQLFLQACQQGRLRDVQYYLCRKDCNGNGLFRSSVAGPYVTGLFLASMFGHEPIVKTLIGAGADPNKATKTGATPLLTASKEGHEHVVYLLLKANADPNKATTLYKTTPLLAASENGHSNVVRLLLAAGGDPNQTGVDGESPLFMACQKGYYRITQWLLEAGAEPNKIITGVTPLFISSQYGYDTIVSLLLDHGADPEIGWYYDGANHRTPLTQAQRKQALAAPGSPQWLAYGNIISALLTAANNKKPVRDYHTDTPPNQITPLLQVMDRLSTRDKPP